jgi:hypothetical protein
VNTFKVGDRVIVINNDPRQPYPQAPAGSVGTVLENSIAPWVLFDKPVQTGYDYRYVSTKLPLNFTHEGRLDCVAQNRLAPYYSLWDRLVRWYKSTIVPIWNRR